MPDRKTISFLHQHNFERWFGAEGEVIGAVAGDVGSHVHRGPGEGAERAGGAQLAAHGRRVAISDTRLGPGVIGYRVQVIPYTGAAVGINAQGGAGN